MELFKELVSEEIRLTPLQVMQLIMQVRVEQADFDGALVAAEKAAPYCHARLNATDINLRRSAGDRTDEQVAAEIAALRAKLDAARALPPPSVTIEATVEPIEGVNIRR
jgi:hypothetical protein